MHRRIAQGGNRGANHDDRVNRGVRAMPHLGVPE
jgi:hypothetical protein